MSSDSQGGAPDEARPSALDEEDARARREVDNGFRQFDLGLEIIEYFLDRERPFALRPNLIQDLQGVAVEGLEANPGQWRATNVTISRSEHQPPGPHLVPGLVTEMCEYVNNNLHEKTALHLAAYIMWRHNWIHPFSDGNGRTSRVLSYVVLSIKLGYILPGSPPIPRQIQDDRTGYFHALEHADAAFRGTGEVDVSQMEELLKNMLAKQLVSVIEEAHGKPLI